jgi:hypothetical protein
MRVEYAVTFEDGTETTVGFEKPGGYHPMAMALGEMAAQQAVRENIGKVAVKVERRNGNTPHHNGVVWTGRINTG